MLTKMGPNCSSQIELSPTLLSIIQHPPSCLQKFFWASFHGASLPVYYSPLSLLSTSSAPTLLSTSAPYSFPVPTLLSIIPHPSLLYYYPPPTSLCVLTCTHPLMSINQHVIHVQSNCLIVQCLFIQAWA